MTSSFRRAFTAAIAFATLILIASPTLAQSEPTVCDSEVGAAFGLCTSYCQAMDCDSDNPQATATACTRVRDRWTTETAGRTIPCEVEIGSGDPLLDGTTFESICPWDATTVATVCASLGPRVTYVIPDSVDAWPDPNLPLPYPDLSPGATSANLCLCPDATDPTTGTTYTRTIKQCRTGEPDDPCTTDDVTPVLLNVDSITNQRGGTATCQWKTFNFLGTDYEVLLCT